MNLKIMHAASALPLVVGLASNLVKPRTAHPEAAAAVADAAVVTRRSILHSGPAADADGRGTVAKGVVVSVLGAPTASGYVEVETPDDEVGFLSVRNLHQVEAGVPGGENAGDAAHVGPADIYPDLVRTPGVANPDITQENIAQNICNKSWSTKSIRPPSSYTTPLKRTQIDQYGYADKTLADYEEDHLISLELGGHPTDPKNLWPEPYHATISDGGARIKDKVENYLHGQVCQGSMTLEEAQRLIVTDWYSVYATALAR
jgi:hypothetical protein